MWKNKLLVGSHLPLTHHMNESTSHFVSAAYSNPAVSLPHALSIYLSPLFYGTGSIAASDHALRVIWEQDVKPIVPVSA